MTQRILVFQQRNSGEKKIKGIRKFGGNLFHIETISIDEALPTIIEDTTAFLPQTPDADLVLDFLKHPDLSHDLALTCRELNIPVIASGKKWPSAFTPAT
jgi:thymidylate synthase